MEKQIGTNYTTIMHGPRIELGLTCNEYCVADMIYHLSRETGWCYASKERLANFIALAKQTVLEIIERLAAKGLIEIHEDRHLLRTTTRWYQAVVVFRDTLRGNDSSQSVSKPDKSAKKNRPTPGQKTSPYNYSSHNHTEKSGFSLPEKPLSLLREKNIEISPTGVKYPDRETLQILEFFSDEHIKQGGTSRPIIKEREYFSILDAKRHLSYQQIIDRITDWHMYADFADRPHITNAFSAKEITDWKNKAGL